MRFYMKCGHLAIFDPEHNCARCSRCGCTKIEFKITSNYTNLENRKAKYKNKIVKSRWDLPNFVYRPDKEYDLFYYLKK